VFDDSVDSLRRYSGIKKVVSISTKKELPDFTVMRGVTVKNVTSPFNAELELDIAEIELNSFIKNINEGCIINDMTIGEPPIESIIKELYTAGRPG
jgi:ABC-type uncharacterized transport system ATPase subunit